MAITETLALTDKVTGPANKMADALRSVSKWADAAKKNLGSMGSASVKASEKQTAAAKKAYAVADRNSARLRKMADKAAAERKTADKEAAAGHDKFMAGALVAGAVAAKAYYEVAQAIANVGVEFGTAVVKAALLRGEAERTVQALSKADGGEALKAIDKMSGKLGVSLGEGRAQWVKFMEATKGDNKLSANLIKLRADVEAATGSAKMADAAVQKVLNAPPGKTAQVFRDVAKAAGVGGDGVVAAQHKLETFDGFVKRIGDAPARIFDMLAKSAGPALDGVGAKANAAFSKLLQGPAAAKAFEMLSAGIDTVLAAIEEIIPLVEPFFSGFMDGIAPLGTAFDLVSAAIGKAFGGDSASKMKTAEKVGKALGVVFTGLAIVFGVVTAAVGLVGASLLLPVYAATALGQAIGGVIGSAAAFAKGVGVKIGEGAKAVSDKLFEMVAAGKAAGTNLVSGLVEGITGGIGRAVAAAKKLASAIPAEIKSILKISSPSKLTEQLGMFTAQGLERGQDKGAPAVASAARDLGVAAAEGVSSSAAAAPPIPRGGGAGAQVNMTINVTAAPGATAADGQALAAGMKPELMRAWRSLATAGALELNPA